MNIFEVNKEEMMEKEAAHKAQKMFSKMLSQMLLESDAPEHMKLSVRVIDKAEKLHECIRDLVRKYIDIGKVSDAETLKKVLEYLSLVEIGINQFVETTPFVNHEEEEQ